MIRLGITGGIGAGKSYVARLLTKDFGIPVYDCDREAKRIMMEDEIIRTGLQRLVGEEAYLPDGALNRAAVAQYLFASPENAAQVNALVHPVVKADVRRWFQELEEQVVPPQVAAVESAILVETGFLDVVDVLLMVEAPASLRMGRVQERDGATSQQVSARMAAQTSDEQRFRQASRPMADAQGHVVDTFMIINDGRDLIPQLSALPFLANSVKN